jgi:deferrochelatase/peroxidase EfeB
LNTLQLVYLFEVPQGQDAAVEEALKGLHWKSRRPSATECSEAEAWFEQSVHFLSMVVLPREPYAKDKRAWLLVHVCVDAVEDAVAKQLAQAMSKEWRVVLDALGEKNIGPDQVAPFLDRHVARMGTRTIDLLIRPGIQFFGTPGMGLRRIREEARLVAWIRQRLRELDESGVPAGSSLQRLTQVRRLAFEDPSFKWALAAEPGLGDTLRPDPSRVQKAIKLGSAAFRDYLWLLLVLPVLYGLTQWHFLCLPPAKALTHGLLALGAEFLLLAVYAGYLYRQLRQDEAADDPFDDQPEFAHMEALMRCEDYRDVTQNHLAAQSRLKPGTLRKVTVRLALWVIAELIRLRSAPGFLDRIGTIHFACWYLVPGTDRLVFLSHYDGSWQSYLEDFIARLRAGLSSIWSNTRDFPVTSQLVGGGAGDGARFKRWARRQQLPVHVWFTGYPHLTAGSIRTNAYIAHGLASIQTQKKAARWLSRLGYAAPGELESSQIPTLVYGGLSNLACAHAMAVRWGRADDAKEWLMSQLDVVSYGPRITGNDALVLGFTACGLRKLGLPSSALSDFPFAFLQGMAARGHLLGDFDGEKPHQERPRWGLDREQAIDMLCIKYTADTADLQDWVEKMSTRFNCAKHGHVVVYSRRMADLPQKAEGERRPPSFDAFGFRDGISQPIVRGTKNWVAAKNAMHVINPGEIVLGYRDNLGHIAPTPRCDGFDYGRNGSFLVARELAMDTAGFDDFVAQQARRLETNDGGTPNQKVLKERKEWVMAKMVGRWRDGTPLVRWPDQPPWYGKFMVDRHQVQNALPDNDFLFGKEDANGLRCPFGAHIRRANPRDGLNPGSDVELDISNRHRILRVGRHTPIDGDRPAGMLFMCLNSDIERQFEFLQQTWLLGPNFHGLDHEFDPLLGPGGDDQALAVPTASGTVRIEPLRRFSTTLGGGYFFLPSKSCLALLAKP